MKRRYLNKSAEGLFFDKGIAQEKEIPTAREKQKFLRSRMKVLLEKTVLVGCRERRSIRKERIQQGDFIPGRRQFLIETDQF